MVPLRFKSSTIPENSTKHELRPGVAVHLNGVASVGPVPRQGCSQEPAEGVGRQADVLDLMDGGRHRAVEAACDEGGLREGRGQRHGDGDVRHQNRDHRSQRLVGHGAEHDQRHHGHKALWGRATVRHGEDDDCVKRRPNAMQRDVCDCHCQRPRAHIVHTLDPAASDPACARWHRTGA